MQIFKSLNNKNIKKYLIVSIITVIVACTILFGVATSIYNYNKTHIMEKFKVETLTEGLAIAELNSQMYTYIFVIIGAIIVMFVIIIICFLVILNKNEKEIKNMRTYVKEIADRNYSLDLKEISESEISNLKEEIYKIVLELKEKNENLENDRETLSNYLADISHQLRTPLMAITAMTDAIIENESNLDMYTSKFIYRISNQLNQINWLVDNLLKMAQLDTKSIELNIENTNTKDLFYTIEDNMKVFLEEKNIKLDINVDSNRNLTIDKKWMIEALENIIKNCIEYSNENSSIKILCVQNPLFAEIRIEDRGKGISKDDLPHIFNKFYKGKGASSKSFGIGLSLAKSIVESQNGEITVESTENIGTTFIIKLYDN